MVRLASLGILLVGVVAFAQQPAGQPKDTKVKQADQAPQQGSLENLVSQALRNNPDIRVAEAKVHEAELELQRTRIATAQKVAGLHGSIEIARKVRDEAEQRFRTAQRLFQAGNNVMSQEEMRTLKLAWERAIYEVAKLEAEMPALLGKLPGKLGEEKSKAEPAQAATDRALLWLLHRATDKVVEEATRATDEKGEQELLSKYYEVLTIRRDAAPKGTMAERIRKALDATVNGDYKDKQFAEVFKEFEKHFDGIAFRVVQDPPKGRMDINLGQVPLGSAIQAVNDILGEYRFVVRDYGILFTHRDMLPPGALLLHDFWKSEPSKEKPKADGEAKPKQ
jgi:hypothetical protein